MKRLIVAAILLAGAGCAETWDYRMERPTRPAPISPERYTAPRSLFRSERWYFSGTWDPNYAGPKICRPAWPFAEDEVTETIGLKGVIGK
jgi:hypothetical protein